MLPHQLIYSLKKVYVATFNAASNNLPSFQVFEVFLRKEEYSLKRLGGIEDIPKTAPVVLLAFGNGVITKISKEQEAPFDDLIPQHRQSEFIHSNTTLSGSKATCFAPNSLFELASSFLSKKRIVHRGFAAIEGINGLKQINQQNIVVTLPGIIVENKGGIAILQTSINRSSQRFLNDEYLPEELAALLTGIALLSYRIKLKRSYPNEFEYFVLKRLLLRSYGAILFVIFSILLFNHLQYSTLLQQHPLVESEINSLKLRIASAKAQVKLLGVTESSSEPQNLAFFSDRIGIITPNGVTLTKLSFNPIAGQVESGDITDIQRNVAEITGTTKASTEVNMLINNLKNERWINDCVLSDLSYLNDKGFYRFSILAHLK